MAVSASSLCLSLCLPLSLPLSLGLIANADWSVPVGTVAPLPDLKAPWQRTYGASDIGASLPRVNKQAP